MDWSLVSCYVITWKSGVQFNVLDCISKIWWWKYIWCYIWYYDVLAFTLYCIFHRSFVSSIKIKHKPHFLLIERPKAEDSHSTWQRSDDKRYYKQLLFASVIKDRLSHRCTSTKKEYIALLVVKSMNAHAEWSMSLKETLLKKVDMITTVFYL